MMRAEASTSSPAEYEPLTWRSHPMTLGPTNPPRLPIELMRAMPAAAAVPPRKIGGIAQKTPCTERWPSWERANANTMSGTLLPETAASTSPTAPMSAHAAT